MKARLLREAAALVAAMHPADRRWVLSRLQASAAATLKAQVAVLNAEGPVPFDWVRQSLAGMQAGTAGVSPPAKLVEVLHVLPVAWAARMLTVAAPDHEPLYIAACVPARAAAVRAETGKHRGRMPAVLAALLVRELRARADAGTTSSDAGGNSRSAAA